MIWLFGRDFPLQIIGGYTSPWVWPYFLSQKFFSGFFFDQAKLGQVTVGVSERVGA